MAEGRVKVKRDDKIDSLRLSSFLFLSLLSFGCKIDIGTFHYRAQHEVEASIIYSSLPK